MESGPANGPASSHIEPAQTIESAEARPCTDGNQTEEKMKPHHLRSLDMTRVSSPHNEQLVRPHRSVPIDPPTIIGGQANVSFPYQNFSSSSVTVGSGGSRSFTRKGQDPERSFHAHRNSLEEKEKIEVSPPTIFIVGGILNFEGPSLQSKELVLLKF